MPPGTRASPALPADVTAVLVSHDGAAWLPDALSALAASTVRPTAVACVDTGSSDGSLELLRQAYDEVVELPADTGYGAAVSAALEGVPATRWVWLLHDDCAPDPDALQALLAYADDSPSAALLGPKVRDWADERVLVEVGLTMDAAGHRQTGLDRREYDQGQHDGVRDVLAVGTAGALIRRSVWDEVGGLDPALPVYRDDVDLGWRVNAAGHRVVVVPAARIRHVRAATTGRRRLGAVAGRPAGIDRRHALFVLLAHTTGPRLLLTALRLLLAGVLRTLGFLLTRQLGAARDEVAALGWVLAHPGRLRAARVARATLRTVPAGELRALLGSRTGRLRARAEALGDWVSGGAPPGGSQLAPPGDQEDELEELAPPLAGPGVVRRLLSSPGVVMTLGLLLVALLAERSLLSIRGGSLFGGDLLPVPPGARDLWASYAGSWHPTAVGSPAAAHPAVAVLASLSTVLLGKPWLAVDLLLLASVPLAAAAAYLASGRVTDNRLLRAWVGGTWALLPVATGAVTAGRLDVAAVQVALPVLLLGATAVLGPGRGWRRAWALGLGLTLVASFAPVVWPMAAVLLILGALLTRSPIRMARAALASAVPAVLLAPWLLDAGLDGLLSRDARSHSALDLLLLSPDSWRWEIAALLAVALAALLRRTRQLLVLGAWTIALAALGAGAVLNHHAREPDQALQLAGAALLLAAAVGADGLRARLSHRSFGWRQVVAGLLAVTAVLLPVLTAAQWVRRGADDPVRRGVHGVLPAFAQAELAASPGLRALVLRPGRGGVAYDLTAGRGSYFGAADVRLPASQQRRLDAVVADLLAARGSDAAEALATRAVRYVALPETGASAAVAAALDVQPGLTRRTTGRLMLWRVAAPSARLTVLPPPTAAAALRGDRGPGPELLRTDPPRPIAAGREAARTEVGPGRPGRLLVLAEGADEGWRATFDGVPLQRRTAWGWAQAFDLPAKRGVVTVDRDNGPRRRLLTAQAVGLGLVLLLCAPAPRKRRGLEVVDDEATT